MDYLKDIGRFLLDHPDIASILWTALIYNVICNILPNKYSRMIHEVVTNIYSYLRRQNDEKDS